MSSGCLSCSSFLSSRALQHSRILPTTTLVLCLMHFAALLYHSGHLDVKFIFNILDIFLKPAHTSFNFGSWLSLLSPLFSLKSSELLLWWWNWCDELIWNCLVLLPLHNWPSLLPPAVGSILVLWCVAGSWEKEHSSDLQLSFMDQLRRDGGKSGTVSFHDYLPRRRELSLFSSINYA